MAWGRVSCDSKTASLLVNCVSWLPSEIKGNGCQLVKEMYSDRVSERSGRDKLCPLDVQQSLSQSEAFPPPSAECSIICS